MELKKARKHDTIRLIFFSSMESEIRQFEFNLQRLIVTSLLTAFIFGGVFVGSVTICDRLFQDKTSLPRAKQNELLDDRVSQLSTSIVNLHSKLEVLEEDTEDLEVLAGLASTDADSQISAKFPSATNELVMASFPIYESGASPNISHHISDLELRINQAMDIQNLIDDKYIQTQMGIKYIPSIRPVPGGRITDKFGNRKDPFIERVKHHRGIDLSAQFGTNVYAVAAGVVEFTRIKYRTNTGYGRVVIINHGNGYKTLYGHLANVKVARGQKVDRWDVIGLSGATGRATGPHLHYEVWRDGHPENPENYILN
jgi:murein DD-endopeptidase MepM/ murein hydrolase activator NlpD